MTETPTPKPPKANKAVPEKDDDIHPLARPFLFLDGKWARALPFWLFLLGTIAALVGEYVHPFHYVSDYDGIFGFYAIVGFFGFAFAVLMGWPLRKLLGRDENYYGEEDRDD